MWTLAGIMLGLVVLASVLGFHLGHLAHLLAALAGLAAAGSLIAIAASGDAWPLVFVLLGADAIVTAGVGTLAVRGLANPSLRAGRSVPSVVGKEGVAVGVLDPSGTVRVRGENWSATSLNGRIEDGAGVQVIAVEGIRLTVWGEQGATGGLGAGEQPQRLNASPTTEGSGNQ